MSILSFEDLQTDSISNQIFRLLVRRSPWFAAADIFELVNPQTTRSRELERLRFPFELRLQSLWEHNVIERLRFRLPEDFRWPIEPFAEVRREDVEAKRDAGKALKFFGPQWVKRMDVSAFELLDDVDEDEPEIGDEGLKWIDVVHIFSTNRTRKEVIHPLICAGRTPGDGADWRRTVKPCSLNECCTAIHVSKVYRHFVQTNPEAAGHWKCVGREEDGWEVATQIDGENVGLFFSNRRQKYEVQATANELCEDWMPRGHCQPSRFISEDSDSKLHRVESPNTRFLFY